MSKPCRLEKHLTAYADGELSPRRRRQVERHLESCAACSRELDSILAFDRILTEAPSVPDVTPEKWERFGRLLSQEMDRIDRAAARTPRVREARPVFADLRRRAIAFAGVAVAAAIAVFAFWPTAVAPIGLSANNACSVESLETYGSGYTPMAFTSNDPEMTVIWVFSEDAEAGGRGETPGSI